jgi:hypothetical protein
MFASDFLTKRLNASLPQKIPKKFYTEFGQITHQLTGLIMLNFFLVFEAQYSLLKKFNKNSL